MKINFHRVLLGFFENWDKSPQKKWDKGAFWVGVVDLSRIWYNNCILRGSLKKSFSSPGYRSVN